LPAKVPVDRHRRDADFGGDAAHRDGIDAADAERGAGGVEDLIGGRGGPAWSIHCILMPAPARLEENWVCGVRNALVRDGLGKQLTPRPSRIPHPRNDPHRASRSRQEHSIPRLGTPVKLLRASHRKRIPRTAFNACFLALVAGLALATSITANAQDVKRSAPLSRAKPNTDVPATLPLKFVGPPTVGAITPLDLMTRVYKFADDSMMGRLAGTLYNDKGTDYIAAEVKRLGPQARGRRRLLPASAHAEGVRRHVVGRRGRQALRALEGLRPAPAGRHDRRVRRRRPSSSAASRTTSTTYLPAAEAAARSCCSASATGQDGRPDYNSVNRACSRALSGGGGGRRRAALARAAGYVDQNYAQDQVGVKAEPRRAGRRRRTSTSPTRWATRCSARRSPRRAPAAVGQPMSGRILQTTGVAPGRNVLAVLEGSDPVLRNEYVVLGAHNDHEGFNHMPADHDSVKAFQMHAAPQGADSPNPQVTPQQWAKIRVTIDSLRKLHPSRPTRSTTAPTTTAREAWRCSRSPSASPRRRSARSAP
jgi:hypothetical protein